MADILIIEDNEAILDLVKLHLDNAGHAVRAAANGQAGVEQARQNTPDLIILDINMPVMDGTAVMKALSTDERTQAVPVIALTAMSATALRDDMYALGCAAYVTKPINFDALMARVSELTG